MTGDIHIAYAQCWCGARHGQDAYEGGYAAGRASTFCPHRTVIGPSEEQKAKDAERSAAGMLERIKDMVVEWRDAGLQRQARGT
jgi:hypothetical protein